MGKINFRRIWRRIPLALILLFLPGRQVFAAGDWQVERRVSDTVFGGEMLVREAGRQHDRMVLLVHGLGDEAGTTWDGIVGELSRDYHVVAPDLPGFGRSSKANHLYSPHAYAKSLHHLVKSLPSKPLALVGHSLGGGISLVYAALYGQDLNRLILVDSVGALHRLAVSQRFLKQQINLDFPFDSSTLETSIGRIGDLILEKTSRIPVSPDLILQSEMLRTKLLAGEPSRIAALSLIQTDYSLILGQVRAPTWLLWGELDQVATMRIAKVLQWTLPNAELLVFQDLGHSPMIEDAQYFLRYLKMSFDNEPGAQPTATLPDDVADGFFENENGSIVRGKYRTLRIRNCKNIRLVNVAAHNIEIVDSQLEIEKGMLKTAGQRPGIHILRSRLTITGADIHAHTGIVTDQSRLDLAGVRFLETEVAIKGEGHPSSLLISSSVKQYSGLKTAVHISRSLDSGDEL